VIEQRYLRRLADLDHQIARLMVERSEVLREMAAVAYQGQVIGGRSRNGRVCALLRGVA